MPYIPEEQLKKIMDKIDGLEKWKKEHEKKLSSLNNIVFDGRGRIVFSGGELKVNSNVDTKSLLRNGDVTTFDDSGIIKRLVTLEDKCANIYRTGGNTFIGDYVNGNYSEIEDDGTLVFHGDATVTRDENFSATLTAIGASAPTLINWDTTSIKIPSFPHNLTKELNLLKEYDHAGKSGEILSFHFHALPTTANPTGTIKFFLEFYFKDDGSPAYTNTINTTYTFNGNSQWDEIRVNFENLQNAIFKSGTQIGARLYRLQTDPGTYSNPVAISTWGYHYKLDMAGSHELAVK